MAPSIPAYVAAWAAVLSSLSLITYFLVLYGSKLGRSASRIWLQDIAVSLVLYYGVISVLEVLFFGLVMPGLLTQHFKKYEDPTSLKRYPFQTKLPSVATFFHTLWHRPPGPDSLEGA